MGAIQIRFDNGAAYEDYMGRDQLAGERFIDWLAPATGIARWLDVGCGQRRVYRDAGDALCAPTAATWNRSIGEQRWRLRAGVYQRWLATGCRTGNAMALPYAASIRSMPLVIFFVPEPAKGVAEMVRVLAPGSIAAAYAWDMHGGGFPTTRCGWRSTRTRLRRAGHGTAELRALEALQALWQGKSRLREVLKPAPSKCSAVTPALTTTGASCAAGPSVGATGDDGTGRYRAPAVAVARQPANRCRQQHQPSARAHAVRPDGRLTLRRPLPCRPRRHCRHSRTKGNRPVILLVQ